MELTNSAFISLIQLSAAINLTFAVILSLFDNPLAGIQKKISSLIRGIDYSTQRDLAREAKDIRKNINTTVNVVSFVTYKIARPICFLLSAVAVLFLIYLSTHPDETANDVMSLYAIWSMLPLFVFGAIALGASLYMEFYVAHRAEEIDKKATA